MGEKSEAKNLKFYFKIFTEKTYDFDVIKVIKINFKKRVASAVEEEQRKVHVYDIP